MIQAPADFLDFHPTLRLIREQGACRTADDADEFFLPANAPGIRLVINTYCKGCPVRFECLEWALDRREEGVWGGMTDEQRKRLRRKRT